MAGISISDRDRGWKRFKRSWRQASGLKAKVGIQNQEAAADHGGIRNVELAAIHEFGAGVPERSFVRATVDRERSQIIRLLDRVGRAQGADIRRKLGLLGLKVRGLMIRTIDQSIGIEPNAPSTIARKGSSRPLIDTGQLKNSITSVVE